MRVLGMALHLVLKRYSAAADATAAPAAATIMFVALTIFVLKLARGLSQNLWPPLRDGRMPMLARPFGLLSFS
jgi:hypothetical protein